MRRADSDAEQTAAQSEVADQGVKAMIPVGRPFLDYVLSSLADAGIERVCLVIGPEHDAIRDRYQRELEPERIEVAFGIQEEPTGTATAVLAAEPVVGDEPFLVVNSDNLYPTEALRLLVELDGPGLIGYDRKGLLEQSNIDAARIQSFALAWSDGNGYLTRIVEKPDPSLAADSAASISMNSWRFDRAIFDACRAIAPSARGEYEIQDAVRHAMSQPGIRFRVVPFAGGVLDLSSRRDIAAVTERVRDIAVRL